MPISISIGHEGRGSQVLQILKLQKYLKPKAGNPINEKILVGKKMIMIQSFDRVKQVQEEIVALESPRKSK